MSVAWRLVCVCVCACVASALLTVSCVSLIAADMCIGRRGLVSAASRVVRYRGRGVVAVGGECGVAARVLVCAYAHVLRAHC